MYFRRRSTRYNHLKSQNEQLLTIEQQWVKH